MLRAFLNGLNSLFFNQRNNKLNSWKIEKEVWSRDLAINNFDEYIYRSLKYATKCTLWKKKKLESTFIIRYRQAQNRFAVRDIIQNFNDYLGPGCSICEASSSPANLKTKENFNYKKNYVWGEGGGPQGIDNWIGNKWNEKGTSYGWDWARSIILTSQSEYTNIFIIFLRLYVIIK